VYSFSVTVANYANLGSAKRDPIQKSGDVTALVEVTPRPTPVIQYKVRAEHFFFYFAMA
jgi:hypothetical protein